MFNGIEKRKYTRIQKPFVVRSRIKQYESQDLFPESWDMVGANDLGAGGVLFNSNNDIDVDTHLELKIGFSKFAPPVKCDGIVVRVKKHPDSPIRGVAAAFMHIDKIDKEMIRKTALEISSQELSSSV